jgi:hypothetical protein
MQILGPFWPFLWELFNVETKNVEAIWHFAKFLPDCGNQLWHNWGPQLSTIHGIHGVHMDAAAETGTHIQQHDSFAS